MASSSLDLLLSSPDPLNESLQSSAAPATRRITRSQQSQRFSSLPTGTPRRQTFELDVGNQLSPQKLVVTVEAEDQVSRRLFKSPAPTRSATRGRGRTTTTTVPLKGISEDEAATPRPRGRPRRTGTPTPASRKRPATPMQKTPRRTRKAKTTEDDASSELSVASSRATPRTASSSARTPKRKAATPRKKKENEGSKDSQPKKRGRPRKQELVAEDMQSLAEEDVMETTIVVRDGETPAASPQKITQDAQPADEVIDASNNIPRDTSIESTPVVASPGPAMADAEEEDIWLATLSDPPVPTRRARSTEKELDTNLLSVSRAVAGIRFSEPPQSDTESVDLIGYDDIMEMDGRSEAETPASDDYPPSSRDHDTIAHGEDFSMISIEAMSSFQAKSNLRDDQLSELGEETSLIVSRTLESLRQEGVLDGNPTSEPEASSSGASPRVDMSSNNVASIKPVSDGPLFSQPASPQSWTRSPRRKRATPLSKQLAIKSLQKDDAFESSPMRRANSRASMSPNKAGTKSPEHIVEDQSMYDDSFSEIPEAVLEAATPKRVTRHHPEIESEEDGEEEHNSPTPIAPRMTAQPAVLRSGSSRLLTPEETPSPAESEERQEEVEDPFVSRQSGPTTTTQSSPPVLGLFGQQARASLRSHSRQNSTETPMLTHGLLPAQVAVPLAAEPLAVPSTGPRPTLSPIVRAGRALQSVTSDPPSPKDGESQLGSPFRGTRSPTSSLRGSESQPASSPAQMSAMRTSPAQQEERTWSKAAFAPFNSLKNLVVQSAQVFSPRVNPPDQEGVPGPSDSAQPAPITSHPVVPAQSSPHLAQSFTESMTSSTRAGPPSDDGMDWDPEPVVARMTGFSREAGTVSSIFATKGSAAAMEPDMESNDGAEEETGSDEDGDLFLIEAQRSIAAPPRQAPEPSANAPRRGKLPSPWKATGHRPLYSDEIIDVEPSNGQDKRNTSQTSRAGDYSMLSMQSGGAGNAAQETIIRRQGKVDLSDFFSSPAVLPQLLPPGLQAAQQPQARQHQKSGVLESTGSRAETSAEVSESRQSSLRSRDRLPSISQKLFQPKSSTLGAPQRAFNASVSRPRVDLFSPGKDHPLSIASDEDQDRPTSPSTPDRPQLAAEKNDRMPIVGNTANMLFASMEPQSARAARLFSSQPPTQAAAEVVADESTATADLSESVQESSFEAPVLKPLPGRFATPSKSCLRSPLKPKTPGRVVDFTSSVLSPLQQGQARAERNGLAAWAQDFDTEENRAADKENAGGASGAAAKPMALQHLDHLFTAARDVPSPLSQTAWSRAHWLRLDELLRERRGGGALNFQLRHPPKSPRFTASLAASPGSGALLGKQVVSQGEHMTLEQWHLDVVDAFRAEVPSVWGPEVIAKRLFALLVGEERRRLGLVPKRS
jgi:serine/arginine repetitive matrix protein 2